jgi:hypothetical protein
LWHDFFLIWIGLALGFVARGVYPYRREPLDVDAVVAELRAQLEREQEYQGATEIDRAPPL